MDKERGAVEGKETQKDDRETTKTLVRQYLNEGGVQLAPSGLGKWTLEN